MRRELLTSTGDLEVTWVAPEAFGADSSQVISFSRPCANGVLACITNFGERSEPLPAGKVVLSSAELEGDELPGNATVWMSV